MPRPHALHLKDLDPRHLQSVLLTTYERAPRDFESLLAAAVWSAFDPGRHASKRPRLSTGLDRLRSASRTP